MVTTPQSEVDAAASQAFAGRVLGDVSACMVTLLAALGDRLDLFKDLDARGPATAEELAARTGTNARYAREWLGGMAAAGYLAYEPVKRRFHLPAENAPVLAHEGGPLFAGGALQLTTAKLEQLARVEQAFREGGGVPEAAYGDALWRGQERFSAGWVNHLLSQVWIPAMPEVLAKLERGAAVADVGCGRGLGLIRLALAYPNSYYVGYDAFEPEVVQAIANAETAGVADRVRFQHLDASRGIPAQYDVITTFDVVHDAVNPDAVVRAIRQSLTPDGIYVCLETNCSDELQENIGSLGALFHGVSLFYCLTTSLAHGGAGLGTLGLHEVRLRQLCLEAGFSQVRAVPLENPFNTLYEIRP
jgi:2-polyprenyl-3-methyl-5-hydroxy-6-metoxy-1,4-benzoquinol methylase